MHSNILITLSIIAIAFQQLAESKPIPVSHPQHEIIKRNICSQVEIDAGRCVVADTQTTTYDVGGAQPAASYPDYQSTANNAATDYSTTSYPATTHPEPPSTSKGKGSLIKVPALPPLGLAGLSGLSGLPGLPELPALQPAPQPAPAPAYYSPYSYYPPAPPPPSPPASKEDDEAGDDDDDDDDSKGDEA
ncbi:hypothetical protein G6F43_001928 [Rhizopus delemar]|nr:hypothetical protein G6F43_001928 [Rhizopus delemar]